MMRFGQRGRLPLEVPYCGTASRSGKHPPSWSSHAYQHYIEGVMKLAHQDIQAGHARTALILNNLQSICPTGWEQLRMQLAARVIFSNAWYTQPRMIHMLFTLWLSAMAKDPLPVYLARLVLYALPMPLAWPLLGPLRNRSGPRPGL